MFLAQTSEPLAVRSSGLLEDSPNQPFAGVYQTYMLPNRNENLDQRLIQAVSAVKRVYASTFSQRAKAYLGMTPYRLEEEKMAVIVQSVVGSARDDCFYPDFAGVARSHNFYPTPPLKAEDGIVAVAAGLGRTVVDGANCVRFSPAHPQVQIGASSTQAQEILNGSQREFYAMDLSREPGRSDAEGDEMVLCDLSVAEKHGVLDAIASTYSPDNDRLSDGLGRPGMRVVTFAPRSSSTTCSRWRRCSANCWTSRSRGPAPRSRSSSPSTCPCPRASRRSSASCRCARWRWPAKRRNWRSGTCCRRRSCAAATACWATAVFPTSPTS
ncbi:MAG: hypothetical protein GTN89_09360, partial [Acidobacteria bacterium]|nr:hypothetical protein [Acidobacteriota bacterium]NIQ30561.1 hypothetical protein [Acidobacteriota bacterium]